LNIKLNYGFFPVTAIGWISIQTVQSNAQKLIT